MKNLVKTRYILNKTQLQERTFRNAPRVFNLIEVSDAKEKTCV